MILTLSIECSGDSISEHERLEATLYLREWVKGKITPEEMEALFPEG